MLGYLPIASAPIASLGQTKVYLSATYNGNAAIVPALTVYEDETFNAPNVTSGSVRIGAAVARQVYPLVAASLSSDPVSVGDGALSQVHVLDAIDFDTGIFDVNALSAFEDETFSAPDLATGAPSVGLATVEQIYAFSAVVAVGSPVVDSADVTIRHVFASPPELLSGSVRLGQARFPFMQEYAAPELWTEQSDAQDQIWVEQTNASSPTWTEAA